MIYIFYLDAHKTLSLFLRFSKFVKIHCIGGYGGDSLESTFSLHGMPFYM